MTLHLDNNKTKMDPITITCSDIYHVEIAPEMHIVILRHLLTCSPQPYLINILIKDLLSFSTISVSRNHTISTFSESRIFFVHFYNFWIQKLQYFWVSGSKNCTISTISGSRIFFVHFYNFWIQILQKDCSF